MVTRTSHFPSIDLMVIRWILSAVFVTGIAAAQTGSSTDQSGRSQEHVKAHTSAKHDVGSGSGDIGKGVGKGAASAAKGTGKAAGDLVTLHPVNAAADLGKGAAGTGKNVGIGAAKGTGKIVKGTGKAIKHLF